MLASPPSVHLIESVDESPIFIIGTGRSGTTLLRQMLNAHPRICITHEAAFYSYARRTPPQVSVSEWLERYFDTASFAWLRLDPRAVRATLPRDLSNPAQFPRERMAEVYRAIMRAKARQQGKVRYGEKNPLDTHNLPQIFRDFKDPRVVCIMRDPRPTVQSFNRMPFGTSSALLNSFLCRIQFQHIEPFLDRILEVRLEDLVADPGTALQGIMRFVGEPWDDALLDPLRRSPADDVPPLPWFVGATQEMPNQKNSVQAWQQRLDPAWIRLIERTNHAAMSRYGYEAAPLSPEPSAWRLALALLKDVPGMFSAGYRLLSLMGKIDRHFNGVEPLDPQRGMEENLALNPAAWRHYPDFHMPQVPRPYSLAT